MNLKLEILDMRMTEGLNSILFTAFLHSIRALPFSHHKKGGNRISLQSVCISETQIGGAFPSRGEAVHLSEE
jgi:hypothetical protein